MQNFTEKPCNKECSIDGDERGWIISSSSPWFDEPGLLLDIQLHEWSSSSMLRLLPGVASIIYISSCTIYWPTPLLIFSLRGFCNASVKHCTWQLRPNWINCERDRFFSDTRFFGEAIYRLIGELNRTCLICDLCTR